MAKKKYSQNLKDRLDESRGMKKRLRDTGKKCHHMLDYDSSQPAGLPAYSVIKNWPEGPRPMQGYMDDLFTGVQRSMFKDAEKLKKITGPTNY